MKITRRELITYFRNVIGTAGLYPLLPSSLLAQTAPPKDEHFFIFVELLGGAHHLITTDYPDPDAIAAIEQKHKSAVMRFALERYPSFKDDPELTNYKLYDLGQKATLQGDIQTSFTNDIYRANGYFIALPDRIGDNEGFYRSPTDPAQRLGAAGLPLADYSKDISVVRGVHMLGNFHGLANRELYSGSDTKKGTHVAALIAAELQKTYGQLPLNDIYLEGASTAELRGASISWDSLFSSTLANDEQMALAAHTHKVATALQHDFKFSERQQHIITSYLNTFTQMETVWQKMQTAKQASGYTKGKISDDLDEQLKACLTLFTQGLTRVITFGVGNESGNGKFDTHVRLFHNQPPADSHYRLLHRTMTQLAEAIDYMKKTPYPGDHTKKWIDMVTVVVSSEFGRPANFTGGNPGHYENGQPGNGHYYLNNNYILFGKNVTKGLWLGSSDPITRFPHVVDFDALNAGQLRDAFIDPLTPDCKQPLSTPKFRADFTGSANYLDTSNDYDVVVPHKRSNHKQRTLMAKDIVKTIAAIAGIDNEQFTEHYKNDFYRDANILRPLLNK